MVNEISHERLSFVGHCTINRKQHHLDYFFKNGGIIGDTYSDGVACTWAPRENSYEIFESPFKPTAAYHDNLLPEISFLVASYVAGSTGVYEISNGVTMRKEFLIGWHEKLRWASTWNSIDNHTTLLNEADGILKLSTDHRNIKSVQLATVTGTLSRCESEAKNKISR